MSKQNSRSIKRISITEHLVPFGESKNAHHSVLEVLKKNEEMVTCRCTLSGKNVILYFKNGLNVKLLRFILVQHKPAGESTVIKIKSTESQNEWADGKDYVAFNECIMVSDAPITSKSAVKQNVRAAVSPMLN
jgi:hypothetical protein